MAILVGVITMLSYPIDLSSRDVQSARIGGSTVKLKPEELAIPIWSKLMVVVPTGIIGNFIGFCAAAPTLVFAEE